MWGTLSLTDFCEWWGMFTVDWLSNVTVAYLVVGCVFFEMSLNTAAQLQYPAPLSLQGSGEGLVWKRGYDDSGLV